MKNIKKLTLLVLAFTGTTFSYAESLPYRNDLSPFIINGNRVDAEKLPWQVIIEADFYRDNTYVGSGSCGGSIIASRWVVTAAHCFQIEGEGIKNENDVVVKLIRTITTSYKVENIVIHPNWLGDFTTANDIALVKLTQAFPHNTQIRLPTKQEYTQAQTDFLLTWSDFGIREPNVIASGYGLMANGSVPNLSRDLQYVWLTGVPTSFNTCTDFNNNGLQDDAAADKIICAVSPDPEKLRDTCSGDSGGPLIWQNPDNMKDQDYGIRLLGLTSFGSARCNVLNAQSGYTNLSAYLDWINSTLVGAGSGDLSSIPTSTFIFDPMALPDTTENNALFPDISLKSKGNVSFIFILMILIGCVFRIKGTKK